MLECSPSTVTRRLQRLEDDVGCMLVSCRAKTVELTPNGEAFLPKAEQIVTLFSVAVDSASGGGDSMSGTVTIGMNHPMANLLSDTVLMDLKRSNPSLDLRIITIPPRYMSSMEGCDFTITPFQPHDKDLIARSLGVSKEYFCASTDYIEANGVPTKPSDISRHPVVSPIYDGDTSRLWSWKSTDGRTGSVEVKPVVSTDSNQIASKWMMEGFGVTKIPEITASKLDENKFRILFGGQYYSEIELFAVYRSRHYINNTIRTIIDNIESALAHARLLQIGEA